MVRHFATESRGEFRYGMSDGPQADDPPFAPVELSGGAVVIEEARRGGVFSFFDEVVIVYDLPQHGDRSAERGLRHRTGGITFGVFYGNASGGSGLHVDIVYARSRFADEPEFRKTIDDRCGKFYLVYDQDVGFGRTFYDLLRGGEFVAGVVAQGADAIQVGIIQTILVEKNYIYHNQ